MQEKYCNREKIRIFDFDVFTRFEVSGIHLYYFRRDVCMHTCQLLFVIIQEIEVKNPGDFHDMVRNAKIMIFG